jgi:predicted phage terminase large subunit-like protein
MNMFPTDDEVKAELARRHFLDFVKYVRPEYDISWHHQLLADTLEDWMLGKIPRLAIFMPPGHAKSEYGSRLLPAWGCGKFPQMKFIGASYAADLAQLMNRDVQNIMDNEKFLDVFPDVRLNGSNVRSVAQGKALRNSDMFETMRQNGRKWGGAYRCAGVGGGLTGYRGDRMILDDPFKNREEANSPTMRAKVWDWFTQVFGTRKRKGAGELMIMTRWHEDDVAGRALAKGGWETLCLPGLMTEDDLKTKHPKDPREVGEALWPDHYPIEVINERKNDIGTRDFNALYQQRPSAQEGALIKRDWFKFYKEAPVNKMKRIIQSWDTSFKGSEGSDFVVGGVLGTDGVDYYLMDLTRGRMGFNSAVTAIKTMSGKHPKATKKVIEDKANGPAIIDSLKKELTGITPYSPKDSKVARLNAVAPIFEAGNFWLPDPSIAPWVNDYIEELVGFPTGAHDDQVDMTTQGLLELRNNNNVLDKLFKW